MRVIVTGAAGFIGSHIVDSLLAQGDDVVAVDNLDPGAHQERPGWLAEGAQWHERDVRDPATWTDLLPGADAVCHQAAKVGLGVDFGDAGDYVSNNTVGTTVLLSALHESGFEGPVVQASSMVVYGEGRYRCDRHGVVRPGARVPEVMDAGDFEPPCPQCGAPLAPEPVTESAPTDPRNVYAMTKLNQEVLASAWSREHAKAVTSLRYHNVYGPRMPRNTPYAGVMSIFASALRERRRPAVFEDGGQLRDFVHVRDVAAANLAALKASAPHDGPLNVASGQPMTLFEAASQLCAADGRGIQPEVVGGYRLGDVRHVVGSPEAAERAIGFSAAVMPADGFAEFVSAPMRAPVHE
ncbi:MAG: NAD-dependent epimerase/dehydratase family protein [Actinomycetia bacterium]|nr:NAD-dependent epimerase/dehydratase family protein [Actinomycetes bacterium]